MLVGMWAKASISPLCAAKRGKRSRSAKQIVHISTGTKPAGDEMLAIKLPCSVYGSVSRTSKKSISLFKYSTAKRNFACL